MKRYFNQRDLMTCAPTAMFNAAKHYHPHLDWKFFKRVERKCKTNRLHWSEHQNKKIGGLGTTYENEKICMRWLESLQFFKIKGADACQGLEPILDNVLDHIRGGGTAVIRGEFKVPAIKLNGGLSKMWSKIKNKAPIHCVFIPRVFKDRAYCVGLGNEGVMRVPLNKIQINGFWLLEGYDNK